MKKKSVLLLFLFITLCLLPLSPVAAQEEESGITMQVEAGFDSIYKGQHWVPVFVTIANDGPPVEGQVQIITNASSPNRISYSAPINLPTQSNKRVTLYVYLPNIIATLNVELVDSQNRLISDSRTGALSRIADDSLLYGVVSPEAGEFAFLENVRSGHSDAAVAFLGLDNLPETAVAWRAMDVVVFNDIDTGQLTGAQRDALNAWVRAGGQLVVTGGGSWQKTAAALQDMLPVTISGSESVADLPALSQRLGQPFRDPGPYVITSSSLTSGELLFHQDGLPILASHAWGRGTVFFLALDPKAAPLLDWDGSESLWTAVAGRVPPSSSWGAGPTNSYAAGTAVSSLPSLSLPSIMQLVVFLLIYTIVMGPVNYFVLKRRRQPERAWITIPVLVIIFSGVTYLTGFQLRGNNTIINQMSVSYSQVDSDQAQVHSLIGLYSPRRTTYDLTFATGILARPFASNFGGLISGSSSNGNVTYGNQVTITDIRVDVSDMETFIAQGDSPAINVAAQATLNLKGSSVQLDADIQNNSDVQLENATLLLGTTAVAIGDLSPGESDSVSRNIGTTTTTPSLSSPPRSPVFPSGGSVLISNAPTLLGTADYWNDRDVYPRYQLLEALENSSYGGTSTFALSRDVVVLVAWSSVPQMDISVDGDYNTLNTTLYLIEIPLQQNIVSGNQVTVPVSLLSYQVLGESNVYQPSIQNLYLNGGWVEFEYQPWPEFQAMQVNELAIALEPGTSGTSQIEPEIRLWDWQEGIWITMANITWGETTIADHAAFIGPENNVRVRLQDQNQQYGIEIGAVYPVLSGELE